MNKKRLTKEQKVELFGEQHPEFADDNYWKGYYSGHYSTATNNIAFELNQMKHYETEARKYGIPVSKYYNDVRRLLNNFDEEHKN